MSDREAIEAVVETYFESMHESDPGKVYAAFHPNARITGYSFASGALAEMTRGEFADMVHGIQPSPKAKGDAKLLEILSLDIAGNTATVRVRDGYIGLDFIDSLNFLKVGNEWLIYNKLFHAQGKLG